ncbi:Ig-like domain-containing protein [Sulfitobacter sp. JB4-11]|uniref:Ig-like domain-containing protein n=1 Tax=Sulfitobacter rhodophyticola TaxID=3238304 RepID=UPI003514A70F
MPEAELLFQAQFKRVGNDLHLNNEGIGAIRIPDYFSGDVAADIYAPNGAMLSGDVVSRLAGPLAPGQYAQIGGPGATQAIGQVETLEGDSSVQRSDGTVEVLEIGKKIFANDVVQTGADSTVSVTFADGTIFSLSANSRMVIDSLVYDPESTENSASFNLVQGGFVFIAGQVAKTGGMDVSTPSATMGIRGTTVIADIQAVNGVLTTEVSLTRDPDGGLGEIIVRDIDGNIVANITGTTNKWILTAAGDAFEVSRSLQDDADDSLLVAEAVGAYRIALARVDAGETFVSFGETRSDRGVGTPGTGPGNGLELDSVDEPGGIDPEDAPDNDDQEGEDAPFDEGRLKLEQEFLPPDTIITGLEDPAEGGISGVITFEEVEGTALEFAILDGPTNGTATLTPDGQFEYTPSQNFNGNDRFTYQVTGGTAIDSSGTVIVQLEPVNDAPEFDDTETSVAEDGSLTGTVIATDVDGDVLSYSLEEPAANGGVVLLADGTYNYRPDADFSGVDEFSVRVTDPGGASAIARVTVLVDPSNDAPTVIEAQSVFVGELSEEDAATVGGRLVAQDADIGDTLTWSGSATGTFGTFEIGADGVWSYTLITQNADPLVAGETAFDRFVATVTDADGSTDSQEVTITIIGTNDGAIVAGEISGAITEDASTSVIFGTLTSSDVDNPDTFQPVSPGAPTVNGYGTFGITAAGVWSFTLANANTAVDALASDSVPLTDSFVVLTEDGTPQEVTVTIIGSNDAPRLIHAAEDIAGFVTEGTDIVFATGQLSAADPDFGAILTWRGGEEGTYGSFEISESGSWSYTLNSSAETLSVGEIATETFEVFVSDGQGAEVSQIVTIEVEGTNQSPIVRANTIVETTPSTAVLGQLTATDAETPSSDLVFALGSNGPAHGAVIINTDGSFEYTPEDGFQGVDRFDYTVTDADGGLSTARVEVEVEAEAGSIGDGRSATLEINTTATETAAAGSVAITTGEADANTINLAIAMDRSGSIGVPGWEAQVDAVLEALSNLATTFEGASTNVIVQIVSYATNTIAYPIAELQDFDLARSTLLDSYDNGSTRWDRALAEAQDFFDSQNSGAGSNTNYLFFITDGQPTEPADLPPELGWRALSEDLRTDGGDGYSVLIEAFGVGPDYDTENPPPELTELAGKTPTFLAEPSLLSTALQTSPVFNPKLVDFELTLEVDGGAAQVIADETSAAFASEALEYEVALAEIADIYQLLGENNRFSATARFDLDGDETTAEIELFSTEVLGVAVTAQTLVGMAESDLLFGSEQADQISGVQGNDLILGYGGDDTLDGGLGQDTVIAGDGDDTILLADAPTQTGERIDGGAGRDVLEISVDGAVLPLLDLSGIEAIDIDNAQANSLNLVTLSDVFDLSGPGNQEIADLLGVSAAANVSIYADGGDTVTLENTATTEYERAEGVTVTDDNGNELDIYQYFGSGTLLATLAIDAEAEVAVTVS